MSPGLGLGAAVDAGGQQGALVLREPMGNSLSTVEVQVQHLLCSS